MEDAALALGAFQPNAASHHLYQAGTDGQTQAGAAETPSSAAVGLVKLFKQVRLFLRRNADAGIPDLKMEQNRVVFTGFVLHLQSHVAIVGELDGIAD
jgi:hypothetical protein